LFTGTTTRPSVLACQKQPDDKHEVTTYFEAQAEMGNHAKHSDWRMLSVFKVQVSPSDIGKREPRVRWPKNLAEKNLL